MSEAFRSSIEAFVLNSGEPVQDFRRFWPLVLDAEDAMIISLPVIDTMGKSGAHPLNQILDNGKLMTFEEMLKDKDRVHAPLLADASYSAMAENWGILGETPRDKHLRAKIMDDLVSIERASRGQDSRLVTITVG